MAESLAREAELMKLCDADIDLRLNTDLQQHFGAEDDSSGDSCGICQGVEFPRIGPLSVDVLSLRSTVYSLGT